MCGGGGMFRFREGFLSFTIFFDGFLKSKGRGDSGDWGQDFLKMKKTD